VSALDTALGFVLREGVLLAVLFFTVAFAIAMVQQSVGQRLTDALGKTSLETGSAMAAIAGAVTPFCSCSTVPVLSGMLQARVRFGVCFTFLIASPVINEGVLLVLLRHQSSAQAVVFVATAFALSVAFGVALDRIGMARYVKALPDPGVGGAVKVAGGTPLSVPLAAKVKFAARSAWAEFKTSAPYLALGVLAGAAIYGYVPHEALAQLQANLPGWALGSTRNLRVWRAPAGVRSVLIAADRGKDGEASAERLRAGLVQDGVTAAVALPPGPYGDWNEWSVAVGPAAVGRRKEGMGRVRPGAG